MSVLVSASWNSSITDATPVNTFKTVTVTFCSASIPLNLIYIQLRMLVIPLCLLGRYSSNFVHLQQEVMFDFTADLSGTGNRSVLS